MRSCVFACAVEGSGVARQGLRIFIPWGLNFKMMGRVSLVVCGYLRGNLSVHI